MKKYDVPMDTSPDSISGKIVSRISPGSAVLEFGCSYGRMTKYMKEHLHCEVCIVELDQEAFPIARQYATDGYCGDIDQEGWYDYYAGRQFDHILFADVLEHLRNPVNTLVRAGSLLKDNGEILISIPNIGHNDILVKLFQNRFEYTPTGLLDNTHIHFWGRNDLEELARQSGYGIRLLDGVSYPAFLTEQQPCREATPSALLDALACRVYNEVYQFFLVLQKRAWMEQNALVCQDVLRKFYQTPSFCCRWGSESQELTGQSGRLVPDVGLDGRFIFRCDAFPADCTKVRLELTLGQPCLLSQICATSAAGSVTLQPLNGVLLGDAAAFSDPNPQLELSLPSESPWFELSAFLRVYSDLECIQSFSQLGNLAQSEAPWQELARLKRRETELRQRLDQAAQEKLVMLDQLEEYGARCQVYREHSQWKDQKIADLEQRQFLPRHQAQLDELQASYNALVRQYNSIVQSQCWKMTKPLRMVLSRVKQASLRLSSHRQSRLQTNTGQNAASTGRFSPAPDTAVLPSRDAPLSILAAQVIQMGGQVYQNEALLTSVAARKGKLLLVSPSLNPTQAPIALCFLAKALRNQGYLPVIISPQDGPLRNRLEQDGFPLLIHPTLYASDLVRRYADVFDAVVVCSLMGAPTVAALNGAITPVLWWIHEAHAVSPPTKPHLLPEALENNVHICAVCAYVERIVKQDLPHCHILGQLPYPVPDYTPQLPAQPSFQLRYAQDKLVFAIAGIQERGQDILFQAIRSLDQETRSRCLFVFMGPLRRQPVLNEVFAICEDFPRNAQYIALLNRQDMLALFLRMDCLICACREESLPVVVTEALQMSKAVICSECTGFAELLKETCAGLVYHCDDPEELVQHIRFMDQCRGDVLASMRQQARKTYECFFTQEVFERQVADLMDSLLPPPPLSEQSL